MEKSDLKNGTASAAIIHRRGFSAELTIDERNLLRAVVRKVHRKYFADYPSDAQCDQFIEALGPIAQGKMLTAALRANGEIR